MAKEIELTNGYTALVDDADFSWLNQWKWHAEVYASGHVYARRSIVIPNTLGYYKNGKSKRGRITMHNQITGVKPTDHKDGNGLNNQRSNLRPATIGQNNVNQKRRKDNKSGFKGVYLCPEKKARPWRVVLQVEGRRVSGGNFATAEEGHERYKQLAVEHFGEFANFG